MFKLKQRLVMIGACVMLAAGAALTSTPAQAVTGYYFVSACSSGSPVDCPTGPSPIWFGPYTTIAQCDAARALATGGFFGRWPRVLSSCFPY